MPGPSTIELIATALFALAIIHTFSTKLFERLAHTRPRHAGLWHLLGEVEVVFGFWALVLVVAIMAVEGPESATAYVDTRQTFKPSGSPRWTWWSERLQRARRTCI